MRRSIVGIVLAIFCTGCSAAYLLPTELSVNNSLLLAQNPTIQLDTATAVLPAPSIVATLPVVPLPTVVTQVLTATKLIATPVANVEIEAADSYYVGGGFPKSKGYITITNKLDLVPRSLLTVNRGGRALINYRDLLSVRVFRDSGLQFETQAAANASVIDRFILQFGLINGTRKGAAERVEQITYQTEFVTDWLVILPLGTDFWVNHDPRTGISWVVVNENAVAVTNRVTQATIIIPGGWQTFALNGVMFPPIPATRGVADALLPKLQRPTFDEMTNGFASDIGILNNRQCEVVPNIGTVFVRYAPDGLLQEPLITRFNAYGQYVLNGVVWIVGVQDGNALGRVWVTENEIQCDYPIALLPNVNEKGDILLNGKVVEILPQTTLVPSNTTTPLPLNPQIIAPVTVTPPTATPLPGNVVLGRNGFVGSGFLPGERINVVFTAPDGSSFAGPLIIADPQGGFFLPFNNQFIPGLWRADFYDSGATSTVTFQVVDTSTPPTPDPPTPETDTSDPSIHDPSETFPVVF